MKGLESTVLWAEGKTGNGYDDWRSASIGRGSGLVSGGGEGKGTARDVFEFRS